MNSRSLLYWIIANVIFLDSKRKADHIACVDVQLIHKV